MRASRWPGRPNDRGWIDPWLAKIEEWVDRSEGMVRADVDGESIGQLPMSVTMLPFHLKVAAIDRPPSQA